MGHVRSLRIAAINKPDLGVLAANRLRNLIVNGDLKPGSRLVEDEIADCLEVSRTPVREALSCMRTEGLAVPRGKKGLAVSFLRRKEVKQIYPLIGCLEKVALLDCPSISIGKRTKLEDLNTQFHEVEDDPNALIKVDSQWHSILLKDSRNRIALEMLGTLKIQAERYERAFFVKGSHKTQSVDEHHKVTALMAEGNIIAAGGILEEHWTNCMKLLCENFRHIQ